MGTGRRVNLDWDGDRIALLAMGMYGAGYKDENGKFTAESIEKRMKALEAMEETTAKVNAV